LSRGRALRLTAAAIGIALGVVGWFLLAPRALGGRLSYVVVARGTSMEPAFHTGDLALVRPAESYVPGQVVAYRSRDLGSTVLHRIVERAGDGYVLKGDNNSFLDPEHPRDEDILGALWIRVPVAGSVMGWFRQPLNAAMVAGAAVFLTVAFAEGRRRGSTRQRHRHAASRDRPTSSASARSRLGVAAMASAVFLLLGVISFSRPTSTTLTEELPYRHTSSFSYGADVPPGPVYADGVVRTGDPLFLRVVDAVDVTYGYALDGEATGVKGSARLFVEISDTNGWKRSLELVPEMSFTGPAYETQGRLDVRALRRLVGSVEQATGVIPDAYTVRLGADVRVDGLLGGVTVADTFSPRVDFRLDALQLQVARGEGGGDPFNPAIKGTVRSQVAVPNQITLLGIGISVSAVRLMTMLGSAVSLLFLAFYGLAELRSLRGGEASRIKERYGPWLVPVREINGSVPAADVERFEDLFRVADRSERMILHEERDGTHTYVVEDGKLLLRYRIYQEEPELVEVASEDAPPRSRVSESSPQPQEGPTGPAVLLAPPQPKEAATSEAEVAQTVEPSEEAVEESAVLATPPISWSDGWAVGPARKR
jgi:signal peptidase I